MGFELRRQRITFGPDDIGGRYDGFEVVMNEMTIEVLAAISSLRDVDETDPQAEVEALRMVAGLLATGDEKTERLPGIRSWNLTESGESVPVTRKSVTSLGFAALMHIVDRWREEQADVAPEPSPPSSASGRSVAVPIPMEQPLLSPETLSRLASTADFSGATPAIPLPG